MMSTKKKEKKGRASINRPLQLQYNRDIDLIENEGIGRHEKGE